MPSTAAYAALCMSAATTTTATVSRWTTATSLASAYRAFPTPCYASGSALPCCRWIRSYAPPCSPSPPQGSGLAQSAASPFRRPSTIPATAPNAPQTGRNAAAGSGRGKTGVGRRKSTLEKVSKIKAFKTPLKGGQGVYTFPPQNGP